MKGAVKETATTESDLDQSEVIIKRTVTVQHILLLGVTSFKDKGLRNNS